MGYRPDIDGLRAIAVGLVVIYHAFPHRVSGGFIGVDIFFVISGYLISHQILSDLRSGNFSFRSFFIRRVRRLFPAMLLVTSVVIIAGWYLLYDDEFAELGRHVVSTMTFSNNFNLIQESGYFDVASEAKPLLHFWSLAVEEQFYILWPFVLYAGFRRRISVFGIIWLLLGLSFAFALLMDGVNPVQNFYLPVGRLWEMLFGAHLAAFSLAQDRSVPHFTFLRRWPASLLQGLSDSSERLRQGASELCFVAAFSLLLVALYLFDGETPHPSYPTLLPVFATSCLLLIGGKSKLGGRLLENKILCWLGRVSYPLYLWHWPLLSFVFIVSGESPPLLWRLIAILLSFGLAALTTEYLEPYFRGPRFSSGRLSFLGSAALLLALLGSAIAVGIITSRPGMWAGLRTATSVERELHSSGVNQAEQRPEVLRDEGRAELGGVEVSEGGQIASNTSSFDSGAESDGEHNKEGLLRDLRELPENREDCLDSLGFDSSSRVRYCQISSLEYPLRVGVIGDSHAAATFDGLAQSLENELQVGSVLLAGRPFLTVDAYPRGDDEERRNAEGGREAIEFVASSNELSTVVVIGRGFFYLEWAEHFVYLPEPTLEDRKEIYLKGMADLFDRLSSKKVYFVLEVPTLDFNPRRCNEQAETDAGVRGCSLSREDDDIVHSEYIESMEQLIRGFPNVLLVDPRDVLCNETECFAHLNGMPLYSDNNHLSPYGSVVVGETLVAVMELND